MESKDTVLKIKWMDSDVQEDQDRLLLQQAEITRGKAIKEVVDYFFYEAGIVALMGCSTIEECKAKLPKWQAKLKEW